jgi:hypothetical protein
MVSVKGGISFCASVWVVAFVGSIKQEIGAALSV